MGASTTCESALGEGQGRSTGASAIALVVLAAGAASAVSDATAVAEERAVRVSVDGAQLHGTWLVPEEPLAHAVIIAGSGPTDRDGNSAMLPGKNNSLKYLAEALATHRVSTLRYDKRMVGASRRAGQREQDLRFDQYVDDAIAVAEYLRDAVGEPVYLIGHSEGGHIALTAAQRGDVAPAIVVLAGPGRHPAETIASQLQSQLPPSLLEPALAGLSALRRGERVAAIPQGLEALLRPSVQPYLMSWFAHDPVQQIAAIDEAVMLIYGETDLQVSPEEGQRLARARPDATLTVIPGMNHVLKVIGGPLSVQASSYSDPDLPLAPTLASEVAAFLLRQTAP